MSFLIRVTTYNQRKLKLQGFLLQMVKRKQMTDFPFTTYMVTKFCFSFLAKVLVSFMSQCTHSHHIQVCTHTQIISYTTHINIKSSVLHSTALHIPSYKFFFLYHCVVLVKRKWLIIWDFRLIILSKNLAKNILLRIF